MQKHQQKQPLQYAETGVLAFVWIIIFASPVLFQTNKSEINWSVVFNNWLSLAPFMLLMLVNHFLLVPFIFFRRNKFWYIIVGVVIGFLFVITINELEALRPKPVRPNVAGDIWKAPPPEKRNDRNFDITRRPPLRHEPKPPPNGRGKLPPYVNSILITFLILGFDTGLRVIFKWLKLEQERDMLEKEKVQTELAFLKNQISPHFFMNTLNNIHALIDINSENAKSSVIKLSKMMRYLLYDSDEGSTTLVKEIEFIKSYVDLMKLRFTDQVSVSLSFPEKIPDIKIPPMLFTSLLENAFKHGVSYQHQSFVDLSIKTHDSFLFFRIKNSKPVIDKLFTEPGGVGLENLKKRLQLLYKEKYTIDMKEEDKAFDITIKLPLNG